MAVGGSGREKHPDECEIVGCHLAPQGCSILSNRGKLQGVTLAGSHSILYIALAVTDRTMVVVTRGHPCGHNQVVSPRFFLSVCHMFISDSKSR